MTALFARCSWAIFGLHLFFFTLWWCVCVIEVDTTSEIYLKNDRVSAAESPAKAGSVSRIGKAMIVCRASSSIHLALLLVWGPLHFGNNSNRSFPLLFWIGLAVQFVAIAGLFELMENMWRPHAIVVYCSLWAGMLTATMTLWYQDCEIRKGNAD